MRTSDRITAGLIVFAAAAAMAAAITSAGTGSGPAACGSGLSKALESAAAEETGPVWIFFDTPPVGGASFSVRSERRVSLRGGGHPALRPPSPESIDAIRPLVERIRRRSSYFNAVSADVRADMVESLLNGKGIARVDIVRRFRRAKTVDDPGRDSAPLRAPSAGQSGKYGESFNQVYMIQAIDLLELGYNGSGAGSDSGRVMIGVLDTGFLLDHQAFDRLEVHAQWDFVNDDPITENEPGDHPDQDRHGTLVLGTVAGYGEGGLIGPAWGAQYLLAKTEIVGQEIEIEEDNWVAGLEWCDSIGADIVTSSLGYTLWYEEDDLDGQTALCTRAANRAATRGVIVCNAVGNYGYNGLTSLIAPADADSVIAVGGVYADESLWGSSSKGPTADGRIKPDVMAQGAAVQSVAWPQDYGYGKYSGTSFATPLIAGLCAQLLEIHPDWTPIQMRDSLRVHASGSASPDISYGWGVARGLETAGFAEGVTTAVSFSNGYPNPFGDAISFDLYAGRWTIVSASIYDVAGRLVRRLLVEEPVLFGATVEWDGRNDLGVQVASGVYFCEFLSPRVKRVVKIVRVR
jgi:hypothetical protein